MIAGISYPIYTRSGQSVVHRSDITWKFNLAHCDIHALIWTLISLHLLIDGIQNKIWKEKISLKLEFWFWWIYGHPYKVEKLRKMKVLVSLLHVLFFIYCVPTTECEKVMGLLKIWFHACLHTLRTPICLPPMHIKDIWWLFRWD
jgi:hypothetical protein